MTDKHPILIDFDRRITVLESRLDFRPDWERPDNVRLLERTRAERAKWLADNSPPDVSAVDAAETPAAANPAEEFDESRHAASGGNN